MARKIPSDRFEALIDGAADVFISQGYRRTQMADVARALGLAKGTLYLYVQSKEALFDLVVRNLDTGSPVAVPEELPVVAPEVSQTAAYVGKRLAASGVPSLLLEALTKDTVPEPTLEFEAIVRELFGILYAHRRSLKLVDRCAPDYPELAEVLYRGSREGLRGPLATYLERRIDAGQLAPTPDLAIAARLILETCMTWAVHIHWDPSPQTVDDAAVEATVVATLVRAFAVHS